MIKYSIVLLCTATHAFRGIVVFSVLLFGFVLIVVLPCCTISLISYSKNHIKEQVFWGFRLILVLYFGCFLQSQPEVFLKCS